MCHGLGSIMPRQTADYHASWLGPAGPRIAALYARMPLPLLVEAVLAELTSAGQSFTAYDVTLVLRALFPQRELPHYDRHGAPGVQQEVHRQMAGYLAGGDYTDRIVYPNGVDPAQLYMPAHRRRSRGWLNMLPLPTSAPRTGSLPGGVWVVRSRSR